MKTEKVKKKKEKKQFSVILYDWNTKVFREVLYYKLKMH